MEDLISVTIISYNSSATIIETMDSILKQTYPYIELVVSDDCSTDDTVEVVKQWMDVNKDKLYGGATIVNTIQNTGISGNCNNAISHSSGRWIKLMAADDMLMPEALSEYLNFCKINNTEICLAKLKLFGQTIPHVTEFYENLYPKIQESLKKKKLRILKELFVLSPPLFMSRDFFEMIGEFDERYPFGEEWPFFAKVYSANIDIPLIDKELVLYRIHNSICREDGRENRRVFDSEREFFVNERRWMLIKRFNLATAYDQYIRYYVRSKRYNPNLTITMQIFCKLLIATSPVAVKNKLNLLIKKTRSSS